MFLFIVAFVAILALLGFAAHQFGADTREFSIDPRYPRTTVLG
jgi:hypothetical protein